MLAVGYDDAAQRFIVRNSWGPNWGMTGYFTMPYGYLADPQLARDFWTIYTVEPAATPSGRRAGKAIRRTTGRPAGRKKTQARKKTAAAKASASRQKTTVRKRVATTKKSAALRR